MRKYSLVYFENYKTKEKVIAFYDDLKTAKRIAEKQIEVFKIWGASSCYPISIYRINKNSVKCLVEY